MSYCIVHDRHGLILWFIDEIKYNTRDHGRNCATCMCHNSWPRGFFPPGQKCGVFVYKQTNKQTVEQTESHQTCKVVRQRGGRGGFCVKAATSLAAASTRPTAKLSTRGKSPDANLIKIYKPGGGGAVQLSLLKVVSCFIKEFVNCRPSSRTQPWKRGRRGCAGVRPRRSKWVSPVKQSLRAAAVQGLPSSAWPTSPIKGSTASQVILKVYLDCRPPRPYRAGATDPQHSGPSFGDVQQSIKSTFTPKKGTRQITNVETRLAMLRSMWTIWQVMLDDIMVGSIKRQFRTSTRELNVTPSRILNYIYKKVSNCV